MSLLSLERFAAAAGEGFDLSLGESGLALTLVEAIPLPVNPFPGMLRAPFSLTFRSTSPVVLPQRLYRLQNPGLGAIDMFLVPVGRDAQGVFYQAVYT